MVNACALGAGWGEAKNPGSCTPLCSPLHRTTVPGGVSVPSALLEQVLIAMLWFWFLKCNRSSFFSKIERACNSRSSWCVERALKRAVKIISLPSQVKTGSVMKGAKGRSHCWSQSVQTSFPNTSITYFNIIASI